MHLDDNAFPSVFLEAEGGGEESRRGHRAARPVP